MVLKAFITGNGCISGLWRHGFFEGRTEELLKLFLRFSDFSEQSNEERNQNMSLGLFLGPQSLLKLFWYLLAQIFVHVSYLKRILRMLTHT